MKFRNQIIYWALVTLILTAVLGSIDHHYLYAFTFVTFLLPVIFTTSHIYDHYLIPKYLLPGKYPRFFLYAVYTLIFSMYLEMVVIFLSFMVLAHYRMENMPVWSGHIIYLTLSMYFFVVLKSFILLFKRYLANQEHLKKIETDLSKRSRGYFIVKSNRKEMRITFREVEYIESLGDYVTIVTSTGRKIMSREKISRLQDRLPEDFLRIHRSFLVNRSHITSFNREQVTVGTVSLPVGRTYKKALELL